MDNLKVKPIFDRILVRPAPIDNMTPAGIFLPFEGEKEDEPRRGEILAAGSGLAPQPMVVKVGDKIFFNPHAGIPVTLEGEELLLMSQKEVLMVYEAEGLEPMKPRISSPKSGESSIILNN